MDEIFVGNHEVSVKTSGNPDGVIRSKLMVNMAFPSMRELLIIDIQVLRFRAVFSLRVEITDADVLRVTFMEFGSVIEREVLHANS